MAASSQNPRTARSSHRSPVTQRGFTACENVYLFDATLSAAALRLLMALKHYAWKNDGAIPKQLDLCAAIGTSERALRDDFKELESRRYITVERTQGTASRVIIEPPAESAGEAGEPPAKSAGEHRKNLPVLTEAVQPAGVSDQGVRPLKTASSNELARAEWNPIYEALVRECYPPGATLTRREQQQVVTAAKNIASGNGTAELVPAVKRAYLGHTSYGKCALTAMALSSRWAELAPVASLGACAECGVAGGRHAAGCERIAA